MANKLNIYDINNPSYLYGDVENIMSRIGDLYEVQFLRNKTVFISKIKYPQNVSWVSNETLQAFNESVPVFKSVVKDMYSIIEGIYIAKKGTFDKKSLEKNYTYLKELREFNNKLKHHSTKNVTFNLVSMININMNTLDCLIQYKYEKEEKINTIQLTNFFNLFFTILEDENIIEIERK